jgi:hypothetical protein
VLVAASTQPAPTSRRRALRDILIYGIAGGALIAVLKLTEYRFLVVEHSVEIYGGLIAAVFAGLGIWLGLTLTHKKPDVIVREVPVPVAGPFIVSRLFDKLGAKRRTQAVQIGQASGLIP